jgi:hypothetical protein
LVDRARRLTRIARGAFAALLDQSKPFGRLALVHSLQAAGTALVTISLAGTLFFSISPDAAKGKVLLYLVLTIAPFALVGPALSPLLDKGRHARRTSVALANAGSALACLAMARDVHRLYLFPEAFAVLVLGKLYLVARAALVPEVAPSGDDLASANAKLAVLASLAGFAAMPFGIGLLKLGAPWVLCLGALVFLAGTGASLRLPRPKGEPVMPTADAALVGGPVEGVTDALSALSEPAGASVPPRRRHAHVPEVVAAANAMTVIRAVLGFTTFFLAFALRRGHSSSWWFGLLLVASGVGSLVGSLVVPPLRRKLSERQIVVGALAAVVVGSLAAGLIGGLAAQALLTLVIGMAPTTAKPALDSIVQRFIPPDLLGRTFGRLETRLQLCWVLAAVVAVLIPFPIRVGDGVVAAVSLLALLSLSTGAVAKRQARAAPPVAAA